jgi:hypothetical protein
MRRLIALSSCLALGFAARPSYAALTSSEKAQVAGFVRTGELGSAARVRALVARPDLSVAEAAEPLSAGYSAVRFDDKHEKFTRELLFGAGSAASRSAIAPAVVKALLDRAGRALSGMPLVEDAETVKADRLAQEVVKIHHFVDEAIANAGHPAVDGHDAGAQIRDDALGAMVKLYAAHIEQHARDLKHGVKISGTLVPVRAATGLALIDLARGVVQRHEVSDMLGLIDSRRELFERHGTLVEDGGTASEPRLRQALGLLGAAPRAADGLSLWIFHKAPALELGSRGEKAAARVTLGAGPAAGSALPLWGEDVAPSHPDRELTEVAYSAAWIATRAAFGKSPELRQLALRVAERAARAGDAGCLARDLSESVLDAVGADRVGIHGASPELFTAHALRLVLLDAPRAIDLAVARAIDGRDEPLATLMVALSVLSFEGEGTPELELGETRDDGAIAPVVLSDVKKNGVVVSGFGIGKNVLAVTMDSSGAVAKVRWNGAAPKLADLSRARTVPKLGDTWQGGGQKWEKLGGVPAGLAPDDGRFVLGSGKGSAGFDAVVTGPPARDQAVHAEVRVSERGGGLLVRGQPGEPSYDAIVLLITPGKPAKATLVLVDGKAKASELAPAIELGDAPADGFSASLAVKGKKVSAVVDGKKLEAELDRAAGTGRMGLMVPAGGRIEVTGFGPGASAARKPKTKKAARPAEKKSK